jgi:predicted GH43/DUF377 family glycosyl hydrolase
MNQLWKGNKLWWFLCLVIIVSGCSKSSSPVKDGGDQLPEWALGPFSHPNNDPLITPVNTKFFGPIKQDSVAWESANTFNPAATVKDSSIYILYRAEDQPGKGIGKHTSRIGLARSNNGISIAKRFSAPVVYPANDSQKKNEWPGGTEDPRVAVTKGGVYVMLYTQWNYKIPRLAVATSKDLLHWTKHGPAFARAYDGKFANRATKSASIVTRLQHGKMVITKIDGQYFMYWGEHHVYGATSTNLTDWKPIVDNQGHLKPFVSPRKGKFDSALTECGPPALITNDGILLLYNGKNKAGKGGDQRYPAKTYMAGQMLFSKGHPAKLLKRLNKPFFVPTESWEKSGQYQEGTVFVEGLVFFHGKWYLYYGAADSRVGVAVYSPKKDK